MNHFTAPPFHRNEMYISQSAEPLKRAEAAHYAGQNRHFIFALLRSKIE